MCDKCNDTGWVEYTDKDGYPCVRECECVKVKNALKRLERSGLGEMLKVNTFENFKATEQWQKLFLGKAKTYVNEKGNQWFSAFGNSGSGKTHLCTAICNELLKQGKEVRFMSWIEDSTKLKQSITDSKTYQESIEELKNVEVLYIDDFFKNEPTPADKKLAMEIINYRYNRSKIDGKCFKTIISSEKDIGQFAMIDEALIGRIVEMSKEFVIILKGKDKNYRLKGLL